MSDYGMSRRAFGMLLTAMIIFATLATWAWIENVGEGSESPHKRTAPSTSPVKPAPSPAPIIPQSEVKVMAEQAAKHLDRGRLTMALAPLEIRSTVGRCDWDLNTAFTIPNDIDKAYVRHRVRREAAIAGAMVAFGKHGGTRVFVTVMC